MSQVSRHLAAPLVALALFAAPFLLRAVVDPFQIGIDTSKAFYLGVALAMGGALLVLTRQARVHGEKMYIRRIAGVDAIDEAVGRSTEMGRPVLYVTGTEDISNIQTIASLLVLGHVARVTAEYDTEITVANCYPITMTVAEEIVRQGFTDAGRPDAHRPENVLFISSEQFAYAAGINSIILRDRPATNIYLGRFFAESLILAETGYVTKAIQIAGTAEVTQLPFFIAACDYTIIGEELYAVGAYLSREPRLLAMLKSTDLVKVGLMALLLFGAIAATISHVAGGGADSRAAGWIFTDSTEPFAEWALEAKVHEQERAEAAVKEIAVAKLTVAEAEDKLAQAEAAAEAAAARLASLRAAVPVDAEAVAAAEVEVAATRSRAAAAAEAVAAAKAALESLDPSSKEGAQ